MANPIEVNISTRSADKFADERRSRLGGDLSDWNPNQTSHKAPVSGSWKTGVYEANVSGDGTITSGFHGKDTAQLPRTLRPGHIMIGGGETTIEAARLAGFDVSGEGEQRRPFGGNSTTRKQTNGYDFPTIQLGGGQRGNVVQQQAATPNGTAQKPSSTSQESTGAQEGDTAGLTPQQIATAASEAIQGIERVHGAHIVDEGIADMVESGYLPDEGQLPEGVTTASVEKIVAGYIAQANGPLAEVGASVDLLVELLSDADLREARRATIAGDDVKLRHIGERAMETLALLPDRDPEAFEEMLEDMRPNERKALSRAGNGDWIVTLPGQSAMSFGAAVRAGLVRV